MSVSRYPWDAYGPNPAIDMDYLLSEAGRSRAVLAAHYLRDCPHIVEIGGYKAPITKFLTAVPESVLVIDPKVDPFIADTLYGRPCRVRHVAAWFQDIEVDLAAGSYGLVLLGCSVKFRGDGPAEHLPQWQALRRLIEGARTTILEYGLNWGRGRDNAERILGETRTSVQVSIDLDLRANPGMHQAYGLRRFMVLKPDGSP